jgi:NAD-dependent SIR2 family protein deacetylase
MEGGGRRPKSLADAVGAAAECLREVKESGGSLLVLTGAGMSVTSGVPVFRGSDGSMSPDFLRFLGDYNAARKRAGVPEADDWFGFSVPEMFEKITEKEAWAYWRWRMLRALVEPAEDYRVLNAIVKYFGVEKTFVETSNCDMLHERSGIPADRVHEIHGSLGRVQCSKHCCRTLYPVDKAFLERLKAEPEWVPRCPVCEDACLRPNVMIFGDGKLVMKALQEQMDNFEQFQAQVGAGAECEKNWAVLEVGAGVVVSSIRCKAERLAADGAGLIRVNPSEQECVDMELSGVGVEEKYHPLVARSNEALAALGAELNL